MLHGNFPPELTERSSNTLQGTLSVPAASASPFGRLIAKNAAADRWKLKLQLSPPRLSIMQSMPRR